jgi:hypothetical protein
MSTITINLLLLLLLLLWRSKANAYQGGKIQNKLGAVCFGSKIDPPVPTENPKPNAFSGSFIHLAGFRLSSETEPELIEQDHVDGEYNKLWQQQEGQHAHQQTWDT